MKAALRKEATGNLNQWNGNSNHNWDKPAILMLSKNGMILDANKEGARLLDFSPSQSNKQHISKVIPQLIEVDLLEDGERVDSYLRFLSRIGRRFELVSMNGTHFFGELYFNDIKTFDQHHILVMIYPVHHENKAYPHLYC